MCDLEQARENIDDLLMEDEQEYECNVCGTSIDKYGICDSRDCFLVDNEN